MKLAIYLFVDIKHIIRMLMLVSCVGFLLAACESSPSRNITGFVFEKSPLINANVRLVDATGKITRVSTDSFGRYSLSLQGITPPVLLSVTTGKESDCTTNAKLRPVCMAALITNFSERDTQIGNINPLTDRIVSDIAVKKGFIGTQQWVNSNTIGELQTAWVDQALLNLRIGFGDALTQLNISPEKFNPAIYSADQHQAVSNILQLIHHNRNYDNNSGETGHTTLTDIGFHPIAGLFSNGDYEAFSYSRAKKQFEKIHKAKVRIFILGDSTSAVYERLRYPRMGWGQAFAENFSDRDDIAVVVGSRAGRSSRDFYNGRWFAQMEPYIKPGDYVLIAFGHNDQNCDSSKPLRGLADVKNLCTYPNKIDGSAQFPDGHLELSFENSLMRYIDLARKKLAVPVLITPSTRIKNLQGLQQTPVVPGHVTQQNAQAGYWAVGDYSQTIRDLAKKSQVPLLDLETASRQFVNSLNADTWKDYWLVVDSQVYPYYKGQQGSQEIPDGTHFQKKGADRMAELLLQLINNNSGLEDINNFFKN